MGLDMYLYRRHYVKNYIPDAHPEDLFSLEVKRGGTPLNIDTEKVSTISENVGYWRKANAIHNWFVQNVQFGEDDCKEYVVPSEALTSLLEVCKKVKENPDLAEELLPPTEGFFFGPTEIDKYYFEEIDETIGLLENLLSLEPNHPFEYTYQSSW